MSQTVNIVWLKRDLRVQDHVVLAQAAEHGPVLPLYVIEPALWRLPDMSARQWAFTAECLISLREALASLGQPLIVRMGDTVDILETFRTHFDTIHLWSHEETGNHWTYERDCRVGAWAQTHDVPWTEVQPAGVIRRLKNRDGWAKKWDRFMARPQAPTPQALCPIAGLEIGIIASAKDLGLAADPCPKRQPGGRVEAEQTLKSFLTERGAPYRRAMSGPASGAIHCSRLSPYIALGVLSMKEITQASWARQRELKEQDIKGGWRGSLSSFQGRLHWRDHFIQKLEDQPSIEFQNIHSAYDGLRSPQESDDARLAAWMKGETGLPFLDACMRCLTATGWMNFRMRAMLMAVASYHLWLDWRKPGEHLARLFVDYEPGIHWSQVQMQSGTTGINTVRIYNPVKQGYDQDPDGAFVRQWVPELATCPDEFIQEPWKWDGATAILDKHYPLPVIDHLAAAREARQKVWAVRSHKAFRSTADAIQKKHGSRRAGISMTGRRKKLKTDKAQLNLDIFESSP